MSLSLRCMEGNWLCIRFCSLALPTLYCLLRYFSHGSGLPDRFHVTSGLWVAKRQQMPAARPPPIPMMTTSGINCKRNNKFSALASWPKTKNIFLKIHKSFMFLGNIGNSSVSVNFSTNVAVIGRTKSPFSVQSLSHCIVGYISSCLDILRYISKRVCE